MHSTIRWSWQTLVPVYLFVTCVLAKGCSCDPPAKALDNTTTPCISQHETWAFAESITNAKLAPGHLRSAFAIDQSGQTTFNISLDLAAGRGAPSLALSYDSESVSNGIAGGFSLTGVDAVTRCPKTLAMDGENRTIHYDKDDAFCAFGKRLVVVADLGDTIQYATWPDTQIKVVGHFAKETESSFEAFLPSGEKIRFGTSAATRPRGPGGIPRAWLASEVVNPRGNVETTYGYCFANANDITVEYALDDVRYSNVDGDDSVTRAVKLAYRPKEQTRTMYSAGMQLQSSLELKEIQSFGPERKLAYRYSLEMAPSETTGRSLLQSVQECAGDGMCTAPLRLMYAQPKTGFVDVATAITGPMDDPGEMGDISQSISAPAFDCSSAFA